MTDEEAKVVGLRAVVCLGRWTPGMFARADGEHGIRLCEEVIRFVWRAWPPLDDGAARCIQGDAWPDLRDAATMGAALAVWQARPGHVFECPCPVLTNVAVYGLTDRRTILALVEAMEAAAPACAP